jgi:thiamine biosynthesis protein ThiI
MIRIAEKIAGRERITALATGESLGQVASQTLTNLAIVEDVATMPLLRPLIGFDKAETIELARKIGTYEISILPHDDCCSLFVPKHPETKGHIPKVTSMEAGIDLQPLLDRAFENAELLKI